MAAAHKVKKAPGTFSTGAAHLFNNVEKVRTVCRKGAWRLFSIFAIMPPMATSLPSHPKQAPITVYSKDYCPYCTAAKNLLTQKGAGYTEIDLTQKPELRDEMIKKAGGKTTVPQIFVGTTHVGGFDDMKALDAQDGLDKLLFPNGK